MDSNLTAKQAAFVNEYVIDRNGTQAAIRAGYSPNGADVAAVRLLANARVKQAVERKEQRLAKRLEIKAEQVIEEVLDIGTRAKSSEQYAAALRAQEMVGRWLGMWDKEDSSAARPAPLSAALGQLNIQVNVQANAVPDDPVNAVLECVDNASNAS